MDLTAFSLNNFWLPMIWMLGSGVILYAFPRNLEMVQGRVQRRWFWSSAIILVLPLIFWAGVRYDYGDTVAYIRHFRQAPASLLDLPAYLEANPKDEGFTVLITLLKCLGVSTFTGFFMIIAAIQMLCMVYIFRKYSEDFWTCIFLFLASTDYVSWMFNGIRQFLAATIIFAAFELLVRKRYGWYCVVVYLASLIHGSALLMLPLTYVMMGPPLNKKTAMMIAGVVVMIPFIDSFMPFLDVLLADTQYGSITSDEIWTTDDGTNIIRVLVYSVPALMAIVGRRYIGNTKNQVMSMCINASMVTMAIYLVSSVTSGIYIGRLPIYTTLHGYVVLPWIIDQIFEKNTARLVKLLMIVCYLGFYYFQMGVMWGML